LKASGRPDDGWPTNFQAEEKRMKRILTALILTVAASAVALGQSTDKKVEEEVLKHHKELNDAMFKGDVATAERLTTDDFMITYLMPAKIYTKAAMKLAAQNPGSRPFTVESYTFDDLKVRAYGDAAIVTGHITEVRKRADGSTYDFKGRSTDTWVKQNGKWLLAARHASPAYGVWKRE
jgi:ketosteroid isomerase-like protein